MKYLSLLILLYSAFTFGQDKWFGTPETRKLVETKHVSILFSSQNLKETASMFGHTLLVFHDGDLPLSSDLTVEFRGVMSSDIADYPKALLGELTGKYELNILLYRMREYHKEGRDLWFYKLKLGKDQISRLILDLKERLKTKYKYSFLRKNCAYFISEPIFKATKRDYTVFLSTIPIQSIRQLRENDLLHPDPSFVVPSDTNIANQFLMQLPEDRKKEFRAFYDYEKSDFVPKTKNEEKLLSKILNIKVQNMPDKEKRNTFFTSKKKYTQSFSTDEYSTRDPSKKFGDSFWAVYGGLNRSDTMRFEIRPAQRSYSSNYIDPFNFSTLEVFKPILRKTRETLFLDEFNFIKLESILSENFFFPGNDKYLDLSFYNWNLLNQNAQETVFRFGLGKSLSLNRVSFSLIPYIGGRYFEKDNINKGSTDQGVLFVGQYNPTDNFSSKFSVNRYLFSPFNFNTTYKLETSLRIKPQFSIIAKGLSQSQRIDKDSFYEIGFAYLY